MDSDRIKKKAEALAERLKNAESEPLKDKASRLAERLKSKARGSSGDKDSRREDSWQQAKEKTREVPGGA